VEQSAARAKGVEELARLVREAHRDQRERMERLVQRSLDPLDPQAVGDPLRVVYPDDLDTITLQGYFGEVVAGLVMENYEPHGKQWIVPAFLFRNHVAGVQALERRRQLGGPPRGTVGRTGDDALAFRIDEEGHVCEWLFGEAKCSHTHSSKLIREGHAQLSVPIWLPVDLMQLIEILERRGTPRDLMWAAALQELFLTEPSTAPPRADLFVYVCGRRPARARRKTWMSASAPHANYTAGNPLEAVEVHLNDFDGVMNGVYPAHTIRRPARRRRRTDQTT
jgi:hypothetical protein